jgi:hypothetical protein
MQSSIYFKNAPDKIISSEHILILYEFGTANCMFHSYSERGNLTAVFLLSGGKFSTSGLCYGQLNSGSFRLMTLITGILRQYMERRRGLFQKSDKPLFLCFFFGSVSETVSKYSILRDLILLLGQPHAYYITLCCFVFAYLQRRHYMLSFSASAAKISVIFCAVFGCFPASPAFFSKKGWHGRY